MNLFSLARAFPTEDAALEYWIKTRWPYGIRCIGCNHDRVYRIETSGKTGKPCLVLECAECGLHFSPTAGTLFHDSHLPLQKWFAAIALMCEGKKGISANQMKRHLGVTYKTAWYLCHRIRKAMSETTLEPLGEQGQILEIDDTFIGGVGHRKGAFRARHDKIQVIGIVERGGRVHLQRLESVTRVNVQPVIDAVVSPNTRRVITDGSPVYRFTVPREKHVEGNHKEELRHGNKVSNQAVEGAFSLFKRGIVGSYHKLGAEHLDAYLSEFCWRFNRRKCQSEMFGMVLGNLSESKPLPYSELTRF